MTQDRVPYQAIPGRARLPWAGNTGTAASVRVMVPGLHPRGFGMARRIGYPGKATAQGQPDQWSRVRFSGED